MDKFFVKVNDIIYGTLFFYKCYFNNIDNLWRICHKCNNSKHNEETLSWLKDKNNTFYGNDFIDYLRRLEFSKKIDMSTLNQTRFGLAKILIEWFWYNHASHVLIAEDFLKNVKIPPQVLCQMIEKYLHENDTKIAGEKLLALERAATQITKSLVEPQTVQQVLAVTRAISTTSTEAALNQTIQQLHSQFIPNLQRNLGISAPENTSNNNSTSKPSSSYTQNSI
jgi:hypothetical protein